MEKQSFEVKITFLDLWRIFVSCLLVIVLGVLLVGGAAFAHSYYTYEPVYQSTARIYILPQFQNVETSAGGYSQMLNAALNAVNDCMQIIQSPSTMQTVIDELDLGISTSEISGKIIVSSSKDSRIIQISARSNDPELAKKIADATADKGKIRIDEVTGIKNSNQETIEQAKIMDYGMLPSSPINSPFSFKIVVLSLAAAILIYLVYIILFLSNDKIINAEDASVYLSLTVLGVIPNEEDIQSSKKYKGYRYYKSKKYGKAYEYNSKEHTDEANEPIIEVK